MQRRGQLRLAGGTLKIKLNMHNVLFMLKQIYPLSSIKQYNDRRIPYHFSYWREGFKFFFKTIPTIITLHITGNYIFAILF